MTTLARTSLLLLLFFGTITWTGCGRRSVSVEFVDGLVIFDDQPVPDATVFFTPDPAEEGQSGAIPATGRTKADGRFRLNAIADARPGAGTSLGKYVVTIVKHESGPLPEPDASGVLPPAPPSREAKNVLPSVYGDVLKSPLRADVRAGKNTFRFELDSSARAEKSR